MGLKGIRDAMGRASSRVCARPSAPRALGHKVTRLLDKERTSDTHGHPIVPNHLIVAFAQKTGTASEMQKSRYGVN